jgi:hypothetical protein
VTPTTIIMSDLLKRLMFLALDNFPENIALLQDSKTLYVKVSDVTKFTEISKSTCEQKVDVTSKNTLISKN